MSNPCHISAVIPEYKGAEMVAELVERLHRSLGALTDNYEIILVNDASPDSAWAEIQKACERDKRVKGLNLSRNFGQHYAISAGLSYAQGDWVVVLDCDLQDRPEEIRKLYDKAQEGYDIVYARRANRKDGFFKRLSSSVFHSLFDWMSGLKTDKTLANFGIYKQNVIRECNRMQEQARSFGTMLAYIGFKSTAVDVEHAQRPQGTSSYSLRKLLKLSFDVMISNSNMPLRFAVGLGFGMAFVSFLLALYNVIAKLLGIISVEGFTTTVFSIWFVGGLLLFVLGIIGLYVGKTFDQVKGRQLFIVRDKINL